MNSPRRTLGLAVLGGFAGGCLIAGIVGGVWLHRANERFSMAQAELVGLREFADRHFGEAPEPDRMKRLSDSLNQLPPESLRSKSPRHLDEDAVSSIVLRLDRL